jgi:hypothetical protein
MAKNSNNLLIGFILLVVGGLLLYWGYNEAESIGGKIGSALSGSPSNRVMMFYIGGAVCGLAGLFIAFRKS